MSPRSSSAAMTGAILTKFGRAPTTWTTLPNPIAEVRNHSTPPAGRRGGKPACLGPNLQKSCKVASDDLATRSIDAACVPTESAARADFRGPDPFDALVSRWPAALVGGRRRRQALIQLHARSPVDLRRLYRRRHPQIAKALGVFGSAGMRAHRLTGDAGPRDLGLRALELLDADRTAGPCAGGYPWDMQTRWSFYPAGTPNVVATTFAACALLEAGPRYAPRAHEATQWVLDRLWIEPEGYFGYHPGRPVNTHNANLLGAWLVHVAGVGAGERVRRAIERARRAPPPERPGG